MPEEKIRAQLHISVRSLVEFVIRSGDIDDRVGGGNPISAMQRGSALHRKLQRQAKSNYHAEVPLKFVITYDDYELALEGRADGVIINDGLPDAKDGDAAAAYMVDEIKGVYQDVEAMQEPHEVHLAQAKCYAYIIAEQKKLEMIDVQMTYINLDNEEVRRFVQAYTYEELSAWFYRLIDQYKRWADFSYYWRITRENTILAMEFPFPYRKGQEKLCRDVYLSIKRGKQLFIEAPTGTGKTIATLFPSVKAMGDGLCERIFYVTAKNITRTVAKDTLLLMMERGLSAKSVILTAKDKICPLEERKCNPDDCPYAKGHFDRINDAVYELLTGEDLFDTARILRHANEYMVCPFELSLDLSSWCDVIVGDYNYVFDPHVYLKRHFAEGAGGEYVFLVDEAHNIIERARRMYSASLTKESFLAVKKLFQTYNGGIPAALNKCNQLLLKEKKQTEGPRLLSDVDTLVYALSRLAAAMEKFFEKHITLEHMDDIRQFYFDIRHFLLISEGLDEHYRIYCDYLDNGTFFVKLLCVDPSLQLGQRLAAARSCVFFSATLLPVNFYKALLTPDEEPYAVYATSVFDERKRIVCIGRDVTSRYQRRSADEFDRYADYVADIVGQRQGNYMIFGPSYRFLSEVYERVLAFELERTTLLLQHAAMDESEREAFLLAFSNNIEGSLLGFCVMGGVFAEGIDLTGDQLIGAVILGAGLPMVTHERALIADYFEEKSKSGFAYAYLYPGMNNVLQAAGRVIRTGEDVGVIALLDERFTYREYQNCFPREWSALKTVTLSTVSDEIAGFWKKHEHREP